MNRNVDALQAFREESGEAADEGEDDEYPRREAEEVAAVPAVALREPGLYNSKITTRRGRSFFKILRVERCKSVSIL